MVTSTNKKPAVGIVLPYLKSRGTERQALRLAKGFVGKGARVVVFVVQGWGLESMYRAFSEAGAEVIDVGPAVDVGEKKVRFFRLFTLARLVRKMRCQVLLSRAGMTNKITGFSGKMTSVPATVVVSGPIGKRWIRSNIFKRWFLSLLVAYRYGFPKRVVAVSLEGAKNFSESFPLFSKRTLGIHNGIGIPATCNDFQLPGRFDKDQFSICYSGSLEVWRKGLDVLLRAIQCLVYEYGQKQIVLVLIGTGEDEQLLREMVAAAVLENHVNFVGEHGDPFPIMTQCNAFILPSRREGLPNALLEAMSLGLCCIAADCDTGPREIIVDEENGLLVPVNDSNRLALAILRIFQDDVLRDRLGRNGRETVRERFSYSRMVDSYFELLESLP